MPGAWEGAVPEAQLGKCNDRGNCLEVRKALELRFPSLPHQTSNFIQTLRVETFNAASRNTNK